MTLPGAYRHYSLWRTWGQPPAGRFAVRLRHEGAPFGGLPAKKSRGAFPLPLLGEQGFASIVKELFFLLFTALCFTACYFSGSGSSAGFGLRVRQRRGATPNSTSFSLREPNWPG